MAAEEEEDDEDEDCGEVFGVVEEVIGKELNADDATDKKLQDQDKITFIQNKVDDMKAFSLDIKWPGTLLSPELTIHFLKFNNFFRRAEKELFDYFSTIY